MRQQLRAMAYRGGEQSAYAHGICIGVDSGSLVAGNVGGQALGRLAHTVLGDVVNNAARLASLADKDQLLLGEHLLRRVEARFECRPVGEQHLPGASGPLRVHEVLRDRERPRPPL